MPTLARRLLITVVVLVVLFVAADRVADYVAERAAADTLKTSQHLPSTPSVDIAGFPFLTQLAAGDFDEVTVKASNLPIGRSVRLLDVSHLQVVLHGVHVPRDLSSVEADRADASAQIDYADLGRALHAQVGYVGAGRVRARVSVTVLGRPLSGSVTARPELHGSSLGFGATQVEGAGGLGAEVQQALRKVFNLELPLSAIPFQVRVTSLRATAAGIALSLTGRDLRYATG